MLSSLSMLVQSNSDSGAGAVGALIMILALYFLPSLVATMKKKRNSGAIFAVNLFLGWTVIGWIVAIVWALTNDAPVVQVNQNYYGQPAPQAGAVGDRFCQRCGAHMGSRGICPRCTPALA